MSNAWYIARGGKAHGPVTEAEFVEFLKRGHLLPSDYVWHDALEEWVLGEELLSGQHDGAEPTVPADGARRAMVAGRGSFLTPWLGRPLEEARTVVRRWAARWDLVRACLKKGV